MSAHISVSLRCDTGFKFVNFKQNLKYKLLLVNMRTRKENIYEIPSKKDTLGMETMGIPWGLTSVLIINPSYAPKRHFDEIHLNKTDVNDIIWNFNVFEKLQYDVNEIILNNITAGKYNNALNGMLEEISSYSKILASSFDKSLNNDVFIPELLDELFEEEIINNEEYNRLNALLLVMDGLKNEVLEHYGKIMPENITYIIEYKEIIENILVKNYIIFGSMNYSTNSNVINNFTNSINTEGIYIYPSDYDVSFENNKLVSSICSVTVE